IPLHATASGKIFLSGLSDAERGEYLARQGGLKRLTSRTITTEEALLAELETVRTNGYAIDHGELYEDHRSLAVPIRKDDGIIAAALCLGGWSPDAGPEV